MPFIKTIEPNIESTDRRVKDRHEDRRVTQHGSPRGGNRGQRSKRSMRRLVQAFGQTKREGGWVGKKTQAADDSRRWTNDKAAGERSEQRGRGRTNTCSFKKTQAADEQSARWTNGRPDTRGGHVTSVFPEFSGPDTPASEVTSFGDCSHDCNGICVAVCEWRVLSA